MKAQSTADARGRWVLKKAPAGWFRIVAEADGFVPRIVGYEHFVEQPLWQYYDCGLSRSAPVSGRVTDADGHPLADVEVRLQDVASAGGGRYESPDGYSFKTDAQGRFHADRVPAGSANVWLHKSGFCRPGLGQPIKIPASDVVLTMLKSARIIVTVDFAGAGRPQGYIVEMTPEGGQAIGTWGGSGNIDAGNQIMFRDVPLKHAGPTPTRIPFSKAGEDSTQFSPRGIFTVSSCFTRTDWVPSPCRLATGTCEHQARKFDRHQSTPLEAGARAKDRPSCFLLTRPITSTDLATSVHTAERVDRTGSPCRRFCAHLPHLRR